MGWRLAESLIQLRREINAMWPDRDRSSDGSVGDLSHSKRKSDHNPNQFGVVTAIDVDADLSPTVKVGELVKHLQAANSKRIKYIIWEGRITVKGDIRSWKPYHGANGHFHHAHISVSSDPALYDDSSEWLTVPPNAPEIISAPAITCKIGDKGDLVRSVQAKLAGLGLLAEKDVDGVFGPNTRKAVINFQVMKNLRVDGIVGANTGRELGL